MSFERNPLVSPFLVVYENGHSGFENKEQLFEKIARTLHEELVKYQEQEAISQNYDIVQLSYLVDRTKGKLLDKIHEAVEQNNLEAVNILSQALQRLY